MQMKSPKREATQLSFFVVVGVVESTSQLNCLQHPAGAIKYIQPSHIIALGNKVESCIPSKPVQLSKFAIVAMSRFLYT